MKNIFRMFSNIKTSPTCHNIRIGIFAGMGSIAGADFYYRFETSLRNKPDHEHPIVYLYSNPTLPRKDLSVLQHMHGHAPTELIHGLIDGVKFFEAQRVDFIVMPCNTVHFFLSIMQESTNIPIVNMVDVVRLDTLKKLKENEYDIGLLATEATLQSKLYQTVFSQSNIQVLEPNEQNKRKTMQLIELVKQGHANSQQAQATYNSILKDYYDLGIRTVVLGCTELPLLPQTFTESIQLIDTTQSLIDATISRFTYCIQQKSAQRHHASVHNIVLG